MLVMTDVQGSTQLWAREPDAMDSAMRRHHEIVHTAVAVHGGFRPPDQGEGDAVLAAFASPAAALDAVVRIQRELATEVWVTSRPLRVRIGVHIGVVRIRDRNLFGDPVNRCARIRGLASGGQTLVSAAVFELVRDRMPDGASMRDLGEHRMKDLTRPEWLHQLDIEGLDGSFPQLASLGRVRHNLPVHATPFVGRERELARVLASVREHRMVTITGFGGMGKTRLALQAAAELAAPETVGPGTDAVDDDAPATGAAEAAVGGAVAVGDVWLVDLSSETDPSAVAARVAEAAGVAGEDDPAGALVAAYRDTPVLFVLDNLEQILGCAGFVADLLARTRGVRVLATSREALRVRAEHVLPLEPMALPAIDRRGAGEPMTAETLSTYEAVRFFLDRARAVKPDFTVTPDNAPVVSAICERLEGHPLALELAAARLRMLSVDALLSRLGAALTILTGGVRDMPERHQTLRATIAWSYEILSAEEQTLLTRLSILPAPADFGLIEALYGEDLDVFSLLEALLDRSMVRNYEPDDTHIDTRFGLLVAVRDFAAEQLDPLEATALRDAHARQITGVVDAAVRQDNREGQAVVAGLLPHVRGVLAQRRSAPDQHYVDLVVALNDMLYQLGFGAEMATEIEAALPLVRRPVDKAVLLSALAHVGPQGAFLDRARRAYDASVDSGDAYEIAYAASKWCWAARWAPSSRTCC